tara:strand:- start:60035 stop:60457 length:423 start_codon:yes stop_codon:yes gene_type:complete
MWNLFLNPKILGGISILLIVGYVWYTFEKVDSLEQTIQQKEDKIEELNLVNKNLSDSIEQYQLELEEEVKKQRELNRSISELRSNLRQTQYDLNLAIGRQETVFAKPELVERLLRRSWKKFNEEVSCASGEVELCSKEQQ